MKRLKPANRSNPLLALSVATSSLVATASVWAPLPSHAQTEPGRLEALESEIEDRTAKQQALEAEAQALAAEIETIRQKLINAAAKVRSGERNVTDSEDRIVGLEAAQAVLLARLEVRRGELANTLAALQRLNQNPPPALAVKPDDAVGAMRSALLLSTIVPEMEKEAQDIRERLSELDAVRTQLLEERETLSTASLTLTTDRGELNRLLAAKVAAEAERRAAAEKEAAALTTLSAQASSLKDLIAKLEDRAARMQPVARPAFTAPAQNPSISAPRTAIAPNETLVAALPGPLFSASRGLIQTPVESISMRPFGSVDGAGSKSQGITIETRPLASVTAPFDGRIAFAGPFRRYGQLLILEVGEGYHLLLAGMARIDGIVGQNVLAGEPVGTMGSVGTMGEGARSENTGSAGSDRPSLYLELRRNGNPVDPEPWFVDMDRKARG
ncbi:MAG: peptidoglycan DD-metalloendopeptidase family protein [Parvibaculum sp.]